MTMYVTNNTDAEISVLFEAKELKFPVGEPIEISEFAARHLFGYGVTDKEPCLVRLGWQKTNADFIPAVEKLMLIDISETEPEKNHSLSPVVEQVVPMPEKARGRKPLHRVA